MSWEAREGAGGAATEEAQGGPGRNGGSACVPGTHCRMARVVECRGFPRPLGGQGNEELETPAVSRRNEWILEMQRL